MRISEIDSKVSSNIQSIIDLRKRIKELDKENDNLKLDKEKALIQHFKEYMEIGQEYTFTNHAHTGGIETGKRTGTNANFIPGDVIKFIKKNDKSVSVQCVTKLVKRWDNGQTITTVTHPNNTFRIEIIKLYENLCRDDQFKSSFATYIKRKESLELLGV